MDNKAVAKELVAIAKQLTASPNSVICKGIEKNQAMINKLVPQLLACVRGGGGPSCSEEEIESISLQLTGYISALDHLVSALADRHSSGGGGGGPGYGEGPGGGGGGPGYGEGPGMPNEDMNEDPEDDAAFQRFHGE